MRKFPLKPLPSAEEINRFYLYFPETGRIIHRRGADGKLPKRCQSEEAFKHRSKAGYLHGRVNGVRYYAHRIIWKMVTGEEPDHIDHINGDITDNRLCNLRNVSASENQKNRKINSNNISGVNGVCFEKNRGQWEKSLPGKWCARIGHQHKRIRLGEFVTMEEAVAARMAAERVLGFTRRENNAA